MVDSGNLSTRQIYGFTAYLGVFPEETRPHDPNDRVDRERHDNDFKRGFHHGVSGGKMRLATIKIAARTATAAITAYSQSIAPPCRAKY
jgi:hypothetical protein